MRAKGGGERKEQRERAVVVVVVEIIRLHKFDACTLQLFMGSYIK